MLAALALLLLVLAPDVAAAQATQTPSRASSTDVDLRTPPSPTIQSAPQTVFPVPVPPPQPGRPAQLFEFHPLFGISEQYSDNFNRTVSDHTDNFRTMVSPGMNVLLESAFLSGGATYTLSGFHDSSVGDFGYFNTFAGHLFWQAAPRLRLLATAGVNQSDQPEQADSLGLQVARSRFTTANGSLSADWTIDILTLTPHYRVSFFSAEKGPDTLTQQLGAKALLSIAQIHTLALGYESVVSESSATNGPKTASNIVGNQFTGAFSRDLSVHTTAGISGSYALRTQDVRLPDAQTDFTLWSGAVFVNYAVANRIVIRANLGASELSTDQTHRGPIVTTESSLSYWFGRAVATVGFDRGFAETFLGGQNQGVVLTTGGRALLSYEITPPISLLVNFSYRENEFTGVGGTPTPIAGNASSTRTDRVLTGGLQLSYQILRWLGTSLEYSYWRTEQSDVAGTVVENRVRLSLNAAF